DIIGVIGIILLIGIVKKNAILMIDFALDAERHEGKAPREAIHQACLLRFRPILMTTMAALLSAVPLLLGTGTGAELRQPLGLTLAGALAFSKLPVSPLPKVDYPTVSVQATQPGASPEIMTTSVATPLERHLGAIADVTEMTSLSRVGWTRVTLQFGLDRDIN